MSAGRPINQSAIDALRRSDMRTLGHAEASDALKVNFGIMVSRQGVGRLRRVYGIHWSNMALATNRFRDMRNSGNEPTIDTLINVFGVSTKHAERLIKGG